jgi:hypothetical protein
MCLLCTGTSAKGHQVPTTVGTPVQSDSTSSREPRPAPPVTTKDRASPRTHELGNTLAKAVEISLESYGLFDPVSRLLQLLLY